MATFFEQLQSADEGTKRRVLVASSLVIMAVVVYVWLAYFNNLVARFSAPQGADEAAVTENMAPSHSFWGTMQQGTAIVAEKFQGAIQEIGRIVGSGGEYIVKPIKE